MGRKQAAMPPQPAAMPPQQAAMYPQQAAMQPQQAAMYPQQAAMQPQQAAMYPQQAAMYPPAVGYPPPANYVVHQQPSYPSAPAMYVYAQEVKPAHAPDCHHYHSPAPRQRNGILQFLAAFFIVCWCVTWPCHGPCCCGL